MAYRYTVQDSTSCTPALLILGNPEVAFGKPPNTSAVARRLKDRMESAHTFARDQLEKVGMRQKWNYDVRARGRHFQAGDLVWVYSPRRKRGQGPTLECPWVGPCKVLERVGDVVYSVELRPRGQRVALHIDMLAQYRGNPLLVMFWRGYGLQ